LKIRKTIEKLELKPGDMLVVTAYGDSTREDLIEVQEVLIKGCKACGFDRGDIGVLVKSESFSLEVVRMGEEI